MTDINLRNYLKKVETLIERGALDEAITHCRHIIQHFPRNGQAYRLLGQALVNQGQWGEAGDVLRRVLSAFPTDFMAHELLSRVYEKLKQPEAALWHLERAFDQQPNDRNVVTRLRELYAEYKGVQLERIQLTAGAVASQYLNGNMHGQAVEVLNKALERFPDRVDLRLMLARALWGAGQAYDAAEVAVEVLNELPYALAANRMMTELWLREQRPSDAQRFLSRLEEVDPYLALRLATGDNNPAAEAVTLPELDYQAHVRQALASESPDWLNTVPQDVAETAPADDAEDDADWLNLLDEEGAQAGTAPLSQIITDQLDKMLPDDTSQKLRAQQGGTDQLEGGLPREILERIDAMRGVSADQTVASPPPQPDALLDMLDTDVDTGDLSDSWMHELGIETVDEPAPRLATGRTGMLSSLEEEVELSDDQDDSWLQELGNFDSERPAPAASGERVSTGLTGMLDELGDTPNLFDDILDTDDSALPAAQHASTGFTGMLDELSDDTLAEFDDKTLMAEFDFEAGPPVTGVKSGRDSTGLTDMLHELDDGDTDLEWLEDDDLAAPARTHASDAADPLAWMQDSGIEVDEAAPARRLNQALFDDVAGESSNLAGGNDNPNAWLAASGIEFDADEPDYAADLPASSDLSDTAEDPLAWLKGSDMADDAAEAPTIATPPPRPATPQPRDTSSDWMSDESMLDEMLQLDSLTDAESAFDESLDAVSAANMDADDAAAQAPESPVDWQNTMPDNPPAWHDDEPEADEFDSMAWLSDDPAEDDANQPATDDEQADALAWLAADDLIESEITDADAEAAPDEFVADAATLEWLADDEADMDSLTFDDEFDDEAATGQPAGFSFFDDEADADMLLTDEPSDTPVEETSFAWDAIADDEAALDDDLTAEPAPQGEYMWSDEAADLEDDALAETDAEADAFVWNAALTDADGTDDEGDALALEDEAFSDSFEWSADDDVLDGEFAADDLTGEPVAEADTGWMAGSGTASTESDFNWQADDDEALDLEPAAEADQADWAAEFITEDDADLDEPAYADAVLDDIGDGDDEAETLDWMVDADAETDAEAVASDEDDYVWDDYEEAQPSAIAGMTGLLNTLETNRYTSSLDEAAEEDDAAPDWLGAVDSADNVDDDAEWLSQEDEQPAEASYDVVSAAGIEWGADEYADDPTYGDEFPDVSPVNEGDSFQWSDDFSGEALGEADNYAEFMGDAADEVGGDWLSDLTPQAAEPEGEFNWGDEPLVEEDAPAWLDILDGEPEAEEVPQTASELLDTLDDEISEPIEFEPQFTADAEGDWLAEDDAADDDLEFAAEFTADAEGDWLTDDDAADDDLEFAAELTGDEDFLAFDDVDAENAEMPYDEEEPVASDSFDWSADLDETPAEPVYAQVASLEPAQPVTQAEMDAEFTHDFDEDLAELAETSEMAPAANAPDWLNAMVPGLDIDYEAEEDYGGTGVKTPEPAAKAAPASRADFDWLNTIVEEESMNSAPVTSITPPLPPALPEMPAPGIAASAKRFIFTRLPAWMGGNRGNGEAPASSMDAIATPDYLDFDEFDKTQPTAAPATSANIRLADELTALPDDDFEDNFEDDFSANYDDDFVDDDFDFDMDDVDNTDTRR